MSDAGDWTPALSAGELRAGAVHLVELGHIAGELLERGLAIATGQNRR